MIANPNELRVSLEQMGRVINALDDVKQTVLPKNPALFATLAEAYLEDLNRLRLEIDDYLLELKTAS